MFVLILKGSFNFYSTAAKAEEEEAIGIDATLTVAET